MAALCYDTVKWTIQLRLSLTTNRSLSRPVIDSLVRQHHRAVGLRFHTRPARRPTAVDHVAGIERRRLTLIVTRIPLAFVHVAVELSIIDSHVVVIRRLHSAHKVEVPAERPAVIIQHV